MTTEEKARAYDEAEKVIKSNLDALNEIIETGVEVVNIQSIKNCFYRAFSELKESEDGENKRISKEITQFLKQNNGWNSEWLSWLEKQNHDGKKWIYEDVYLKEKEQLIQDGINEVLENPQKYGLEKQGKQKPVDKVEPKFKVGDKIRRKTPSFYDKDMQVARIDKDYYVCNHINKFSSEVVPFLEQSSYELIKQKSTDKVEPTFKIGDYIKHNKANIICKVISTNSGSYYVDNIETSCRIELFNAEQNFHLWTIQDAKDGDMLACNINKSEIGGDIEKLPNITPTICVYQNVVKDKDYIHTYCSLYNGSSLVQSNSMYYNTFVYNIQPATKEQRDLLFQKMKEAGYEWNAEKKELRQIEKQGEMSSICERYDSIYPQNKWKPSDEQLDALHDAAMYVDKSMFPYPKGTLMKLYKQIKKLREE